MSVQQQLRIWLIGIIITALLLWALSDVLLPFVAGFAVAYFLDPVADRLESWRLPRLAATSVITAAFFITLVALIILLIPLLSDQLGALARAWPGYMERINNLVALWTGSQADDLLASSEGLSSRVMSLGANVLQDIAGRSLAVLNLVGMLAITPVVSFYLLNDWDRIVERIDALLPRPYAPRLRIIASEIDKVLAGFVRGTGTVCLVLAVFYASALEMAGLEFGLVVGILSGLISFIPFVGMIVGLIMSTVLALFQFLPDQPHMVGVIVAIFVAGQILEGNFLTPNLVGKNIGLHPVWVIFALLAFGSLFGFVGMLVSVPLAATLGVLARHSIDQYRKSALYLGEVPENLSSTAELVEAIPTPTDEETASSQDSNTVSSADDQDAE